LGAARAKAVTSLLAAAAAPHRASPLARGHCGVSGELRVAGALAALEGHVGAASAGSNV
jgi:hypothetical protein